MSKDRKYIRKTQTSVTCFLHCGRDYLFLLRDFKKRVDSGKLNGVGGRLEPGENYGMAAVREIFEETGYKVSFEDLQLSGVVKLGGDDDESWEDWVMCFFKVGVSDKNILKSNKIDDGKLIWLDQDKVLNSDYELVDDLNYLWKDIVDGSRIFLMAGKWDKKGKIDELSVTRLSR